jgi:rhomboid protease GluP
MAEELTEQTKTTAEQGGSPGNKKPGFISLLLPGKNYLVTPVIVGINVLVFILMVISGVDAIDPTGEDLLKWGADYRPMTLNGEWWRLLTACFLHIGVIHLLFNMYALLSIGHLLEKIMGTRDFLIGYLLTGIASSSTSILWHENTVSAGASGAIFGVYGIFIALLTTNLIDPVERSAQLKSILIFIGYNLMYGLQGGVDNAAHIGGLLSGIIFGYGFYYLIKKRESSQQAYLMIGAMMATVIVYTACIFNVVSDDISIYFRKMETVQQTEHEALAFYRLPENTSNEVYLKNIEDGLRLFKQTLPEFTAIDQLDLPDNIKQRHDLLKEYWKLRIASFQLLNKAFKENTGNYNPEIEAYNLKIDSIIKKIDSI